MLFGETVGMCAASSPAFPKSLGLRLQSHGIIMLNGWLVRTSCTYEYAKIQSR